MTKGKSKIVKLAGTSYFRRIRVSSNSNRLVQFYKVPRVRIPLSPQARGAKMYQNAQNQRFGHFFCPNRCAKMLQNAPFLGCLAGCFFEM